MKNGEGSTDSISNISVQSKIEMAMKECGEGERWESIFLFSSEGLLMAHSGISSDYSEESLLEFAFSLNDLVKLLRNDLSVKEIIINGIHKKKLVFRYFYAWSNQVVIAAVISGRKGYRRALGRLIKWICQYVAEREKVDHFSQ
ncbi:hypothetical protein MUP95_00985 [bacterium]|nr:hypothetical protein [bacterium]